MYSKSKLSPNIGNILNCLYLENVNFKKCLILNQLDFIYEFDGSILINGLVKR